LIRITRLMAMMWGFKDIREPRRESVRKH